MEGVIVPCFNQLTKTKCEKRCPGCKDTCKAWADYEKAYFEADAKKRLTWEVRGAITEAQRRQNIKTLKYKRRKV
ncbi:MAG: hypothetical protein KBS59_00215 [Clostridiales bacterium]|nr:hypothetical protein [Clostridiales bacterium]